MSFSDSIKVLVLPLAVSLAACSSVGVGSSRVAEVRQITQSDHCGLTGPGVVFVDSAEDLEPLLGVSGQNLSTRLVREVDLASEHLVFVTLGQRPTAGYSVSLDKAHISGNTLSLDMLTKQPEPGMMVAQVITSPCAVLAVPGVEWGQVRVVGISDKPLVRNLDP